MKKKQLDESLKNHVIDLYIRKYKISTIAEIYQICEKTVYNIISKYNNTQSVTRKIGSGKKLDDNIWNIIKTIIEKDNNLVLSEISAILSEKHNIKCSKSTVHEYLIKNNYVSKKPILKPILTEKNLNERENWAIFYQNHQWDNVIWSDETAISIQPNTYSKIWLHKDTTVVKRIVKYPLKIHIWGCILKNNKLIIHIYDKTMNSDKYIEILKLKLLPLLNLYNEKNHNKLIFQQDNAPCHTSLKLIKFFSENNVEVMFWPANSPDLNPIENVWNLLKKNIGKICVKNKEELINNIVDQADKLEINIINKIINSMDNRVNELFNNSFDSINY
jgi:transposase